MDIDINYQVITTLFYLTMFVNRVEFPYMEEKEIKFLDVDVESLKKQLLEIGATKQGEYFYKRTVFDYPDWRLNSGGAWLRLRTDGTVTTLTYKKRLGMKSSDSLMDDGMHEIETIVEDYQKTYDILLAIGMVIKREQENKRTRYVRGDVEFDIDTHPFIPTYLEIEGKEWGSVEQACNDLSLTFSEGLRTSTMQIYETHGINEDDYKRIAFSGLEK
jgi:adenylate cyclase class 2